MEKEEDHITLLLQVAIEKLQKVLIWELSLLYQSRKEKNAIFKRTASKVHGMRQIKRDAVS